MSSQPVTNTPSPGKAKPNSQKRSNRPLWDHFIQNRPWLSDPWEGRQLSRKISFWIGFALIFIVLCDQLLVPHVPMIGWPLWIICLLIILVGSSALTLFIYSNLWGRYRFAERLAESLKKKEGSAILDLNMADSVFAAAFARKLKSSQVYGIGNWRNERKGKRELLRLMRRFQALRLSKKVTIEMSGLLPTTFAEEMFDVVFFRESERFSVADSDLPQLVKEISRILKPDGEFIILTFRRFDTFRSLFKALGVGKCRFSYRLYDLFPPLRLLRGVKPNLKTEKR